jgi:hypothetical protein
VAGRGPAASRIAWSQHAIASRALVIASSMVAPSPIMVFLTWSMLARATSGPIHLTTRSALARCLVRPRRFTPLPPAARR